MASFEVCLKPRSVRFVGTARGNGWVSHSVRTKNLLQDKRSARTGIVGVAACPLGDDASSRGVTESVTVTGGGISDRDARKIEEQARKAREAQMTAPSANVLNLQRRVAGILPVRVDVPRAGKSYRFVRPLVLEEETTVSFQYKSK